MRLVSWILMVALVGLAGTGVAKGPNPKKKKLVVVAGKPSHPPRMHEFNAGVQLLAKCLDHVSQVDTHVVLNGWPTEETVFQDADAVVFYMDGGRRHEVVQEEGRRQQMLQTWADKGVGLGFMHFGVEVVADQAGSDFKKWIGGHYDHMFSCNPIWEPEFKSFPEHEITQGVKPFSISDEWYFNIRFIEGPGNQARAFGKMQFTPILVATPSQEVRDGPYVYPKGPYQHIQDASERPESMMWAVEREDGGRGFGFTGGHFHNNWENDDFRKVVLNAMVWLTKTSVPNNGVESTVTTEMLNENLDPK